MINVTMIDDHDDDDDHDTAVGRPTQEPLRIGQKYRSYLRTARIPVRERFVLFSG